MLKLFPKIPISLEQIHIFKASIVAELITNLTAIQFIFGVFSRAAFKRCQERFFRSLYQERLCFTWAVGLLLSLGHNGKFPSSLWPLGSSEPDLWPIPYILWHTFHVLTLLSYLYFSFGYFFIWFYFISLPCYVYPKATSNLFFFFF